MKLAHKALGRLLLRSFIHSRSFLIRLLCTACFTHYGALEKEASVSELRNEGANFIQFKPTVQVCNASLRNPKTIWYPRKMSIA